METTTMASVVVLVVAGLAGLGFFLASLYSANRKVEKYLLERGATDVAIHYELFDLDRDTATFTVRYTGISGDRRQTSCKIRHVFLLFDDVIYWSNPLEMDLLHVEQPNTSWKTSRPEPMRASRQEERE